MKGAIEWGFAGEAADGGRPSLVFHIFFPPATGWGISTIKFVAVTGEFRVSIGHGRGDDGG